MAGRIRVPGRRAEGDETGCLTECPHCRNRIEVFESGSVFCPWSYCRQPFTVHLFSPTRVHTIAAETFVEIEGEGTSCYFHESNKAVAVCSRCGSFICALCRVEIGETTICTKCFDYKKEKKEFGSRKVSAIAWGPLLSCAALIGLIPFLGLITVLPGIPIGIYGLHSMKKDNMTYGRISVIVGIVVHSILLIYQAAILFLMIT
ncbi:MAG: hypothetical protein ACYS8W_05640 [Planctomycetota bacterium]|jgi:hypothetical protein